MTSHTSQNGTSVSTFTLRDLFAILFRHKGLMILSFVGIVLGSIAAAALQPARYDAAMEILVKRDRVNSIVTADSNAVTQVAGEITEEELNSEVELLKSRDLLEKIVLAFDLQHPVQLSQFGILAEIFPPAKQEAAGADRIAKSIAVKSDAAQPDLRENSLLVDPSSDPTNTESKLAIRNRQLEALVQVLRQRSPKVSPAQTELSMAISPVATEPRWNGSPENVPLHAVPQATKEDISVEKAVLRLDRKLSVGVVKKTNLISVHYESPDRELSARVLNLLAHLYIEKHVTVHRTVGAFDFFHQEGQQFREELTQAESRLLDYNRTAGVVSAPVEKEAVLQRTADFVVALKQTETSAEETRRRIRTLEDAVSSTVPRMTTQVRNADNAMLMAQLKANLLTLEQKRVELLTKFEPGYRTVQEVEEQIKQARAAIVKEDTSKVHEETTDRDPTYEWARGELMKARTDLAGLEGRATATSSAIRSYQESAQRLQQEEIAQNDLIRTIKAAEENYLLSVRKEEEARLSDALDRGRILNVAIAEAATVPAIPANHRLMTVLVGLLVALAVSVGLAFGSEYLDSTFRTPDEVASVLDVPVLAAVPRDAENRGLGYAARAETRNTF